MDDDQQLACVAPDAIAPLDMPPVCVAPPAATVSPDAAAAPGPAPGNADNPLLSAVGTLDGGDAATRGGQCDSLHPDNCPPETVPDQPVFDGVRSVAWDALGLIPGVGAAETVYDAGKAGLLALLGDKQGAQHAGSDALMDAVGCVPGLGPLVGAFQTGWDGAATVSRAAGNTKDPMFGDLAHDFLFGADVPSNGGG